MFLMPEARAVVHDVVKADSREVVQGSNMVVQLLNACTLKSVELNYQVSRNTTVWCGLWK